MATACKPLFKTGVVMTHKAVVSHLRVKPIE